ncbi:MAG: AbrB/MazE/SpoVT family DNA-binding domain-containing protein [Desulfamplus sp.]|nr:AbrB/MazE/SpoVT family DNA-binding domain-containing protein [Desulfamplus sp.]
MALATITNKGQVTIPKNIRESLKLNTGDKIEIIITDKMEAVIRPVLKPAFKTVDDLFGKLHKPDRKAVSTEEIDDAIRNRMRKQFK